LFIAFAALSAASLPAVTAVAQPPSIRVEPVQKAGSASAAPVSAQIDLAGLEAGARQAQQRHATALAREHAAASAAVASERRSESALTTAARARAQLDQLGLLVAAAYRADISPSLSSLTVVPTGHHAEQQRTAADVAALTTTKNLVARSTVEATEAIAAASQDLDTLGRQLDALLQRPPIPLGELSEAADRESGTIPSTPSRHYEPEVARRAVDFALAQIGKPYVWGATGPGSFDCSGLAMRAYQAAGVRLPHFAAFQYANSHPLARGQLQRGDLLFWATSPRNPATIYHEAIYLGGGLMVQAPKSHWRISVADMRMWGPIQFYARPY
jgi:cell wall-associated NlpC family hydrolase